MMETGENPFGKLIGLRLSEWGDGVCIYHLTVSEEHLNPNGVVHGAVIYALADTGMGGALVSSLPEGQQCATIEIKISYYRPARSGELSGKAHVVRLGKRIAFMAAEVHNNDTLIAQATGTFAISSLK